MSTTLHPTGYRSLKFKTPTSLMLQMTILSPRSYSNVRHVCSLEANQSQRTKSRISLMTHKKGALRLRIETFNQTFFHQQHETS